MFNTEILKPFLESIDKFGAYNAFCINNRLYTYSEFADTVSKVRFALRIRTNTCTNTNTTKNIGLLAYDDLETYASIFAIWLEGYAYVPIHPNQPLERNAEIIDQSDINLLISSRPVKDRGICDIIDSSSYESGRAGLEPGPADDDDLAYILFTSGSTGKPKGVTISRKNIGAFMRSFRETGININENDRCLQCFDLTFDVSVQSFLVPLTRGACTFTVPAEQIKYSYVAGLLEEQHITFGAMAPSMIRYLRPYFNEISAPDMRCNILTAEASLLDLVEEWSKCIPNSNIYNFYGPTECTIYCTYQKFTRTGTNKQLNGMMSIGKPMSGLKAIIIDEESKVLGENATGELCISGDQITPGYWKNKEKNKESFFEIRFMDHSERYYRTGDSCYIDEDGDIMLIGRLDHQVKIQGYRVELGEIEYHARKYLNGQNAAACTFSNSLDNIEIALFIEGKTIADNGLVNYLKENLPHYMIPTRIIFKSIFPLNNNGKVDRIELKRTIDFVND